MSAASPPPPDDAAAAVAAADATQLPQPHAFHLNLPPHFRDATSGVPHVTRFAAAKARQAVELAFSIRLAPELFAEQQRNGGGGGDGDAAMHDDAEDNNDDDAAENNNDEFDDDDEDDEIVMGNGASSRRPETLQSLAKKCNRLNTILSSLESLKFGGISQAVLMDLVLHLLRLVTATVSYDDEDAGTPPTLHFENVGAVVKVNTTDGTGQQQGDAATSDELEYKLPEDEEKLAAELKQPFALPSPTRETILLTLINLLSNKGPLRSVSNAALFPKGSDDDNDKGTKPRSLLILQWKPLLRMLLRTAPYLNEHAESGPVRDSNSRTSSMLKRSVQFIRDARHFFPQGLGEGLGGGGAGGRGTAAAAAATAGCGLDRSAREIWSMVRSDVLFHSHTHACYRGTILLYLFQPSRCSPDYYLSVLPHWWTAWTNIDRCPEYDFLWLALLARARKYVDPAQYDWAPVRKRLLTHSQYWLQLPIGGTALDKSFPRAGSPRSRSCPPRLKVFAGANSSYDEGIDFVAKVTKLLVAGLGTGRLVEKQQQQQPEGHPAFTEGTNDVLRFMTFVTPYFHPSNVGQWTFTLGAFLHYFAYEFCSRMGGVAGNEALRKTHPAVVDAMREAQPGSHCAEIPPHEVVALMDALLPLCQQALYSKNGHVGRAGEAAMLYMVQIDAAHSTPFFIDFACRALDVSAINLSHQAPAALSALTRLVQPALRSKPSILLARLPELLRLSLAGIDSNDQNKSIRTLILYRNLASWIPTGGQIESWTTLDLKECESRTDDGTLRLGDGLYGNISDLCNTKEYAEALNRLPSTSLLKQGVSADEETDPDMQRLLLNEATSAMSDWALDFLERIFGLLRASGEREKTGRRVSGVASRHSSADVHQARNFSRVLKETLLQVFSGMDEETHRLCVRTVVKFLEEETLPTASKDASLLCQAAAAARLGDVISPGLDSLVPVLTDDLYHHSTKTVAYRLRCLAGAVRSASHGVVKHRAAISGAISFALSSDDRHLFKTGCKLLRHTLSTLVESYPLAADAKPRAFLGGPSSSEVYLGRSAQLHRDAVRWHVPSGESIDFAWDLLNSHVVQRLDSLCEGIDGAASGDVRSKMLNALEVNDLRRCLRVVRYSIRGGSSVLLEADAVSVQDKVDVPYEKACSTAIASAGDGVLDSLLTIRGRLCSFLVVLSSVMASETLYPDQLENLPSDNPYQKILPLIGSDPKICKETCDISLLLLTRRGSAFRSTEARTIWKAQKQLASDYMLCAQVDHMAEILQSASMYGDATAVLYKDGEDGGKTLPRRLLVARVQLFHDSLQRNASFEIPRRLRRFEIEAKPTKRRLFSVSTSLPGMIDNLESLLVSTVPTPLDAYDGLADGLYSLCCHPSTQVRSSALSVIDYTMTRFGWLVAIRVPRLLSGLALQDETMNGKFGIPSCSSLVGSINHQGKRKKLAEAVKGVCSILSLSRAIKHVLGIEKLRSQFVLTVCSTDGLISLLPTEEMHKLVHYLQAVFSSFRSKVYYQPRVTKADREGHTKTLHFILDILSEKRTEGTVDLDSSSENVGAVHWRKRLLACWFLLALIQEDDFRVEDGSIGTRIWSTCYRILETEKGQPLQRVALGLFGRLIQLAGGKTITNDLFREKLGSEAFCRTLGEALVYDHREDTSVGGGHDAQWATGVEDIIRDAGRNVAPRTLFPFQRTSQALGSFKASHSHLLEKALSSVDKETASTSILHLLKYSKEMAAAPPSEDQKNQQITSAEIFAGICAYRLQTPDDSSTHDWNTSMLPHLDDVMGKIPFSLSGAYFDAIRFSLQFCPPSSFYPLTQWLVDRICATLWQPSPSSTEDETTNGDALSQMSINGSSHGSEGFTAQSKWLYLFTAVLIEMDESEAGNTSPSGWYTSFLTAGTEPAEKDDSMEDPELEFSWQLVIDKLLPRLTIAIGHPFDSCRDHISRCLFRICYCHRKRARICASRVPSSSSSLIDDDDDPMSPAEDNDPGTAVVKKLASLENCDGWLASDRYNALSTTRRFIAYSVHLGEARFEYSDYVIPLLPLTFEAIKSTIDDEQKTANDPNHEESVANRALEAEVIKGYRYTIAELSITAVISYGNESDVAKVLDVVGNACHHEKWQVRHAASHFLRCFQGAHKFIFTSKHAVRTMQLVADLLADDRREVSSAAMAALTGILAASPVEDVAGMVKKYISIAGKSKKKKLNKNAATSTNDELAEAIQEKELKRARNQKTAVFFLCAAIMAQPYDTPQYVPAALAAISKHSFERNAPLGVRDTVKRCCAEYKKTHMSDNWEVHRAVFSQEQLEALEDVVSSPHYYA